MFTVNIHNINFMMDKYRIKTYSELANRISIDTKSLHYALNSISNDISIIQTIADYFNCTLSNFILERSDDVLKYDFKNKTYDPYLVPAAWKVLNYSDDMDEMCNCAECGKSMTFGDGYTSRCIHSDKIGAGYCVCYDCYVKEVENERNF